MFWKYNIWGVFWLLFILVASAIPGEQLPPSPVIGFDKFGHLIIYGLLQGILLRGFALQQRFTLLRKYYLLIAVILSASYGALMELMQEEVFRNRSFDVYDMMANVAGVLLATIIWMVFFRKKIEQKQKKNI